MGKAKKLSKEEETRDKRRWMRWSSAATVKGIAFSDFAGSYINAGAESEFIAAATPRQAKQIERTRGTKILAYVWVRLVGLRVATCSLQVTVICPSKSIRQRKSSGRSLPRV